MVWQENNCWKCPRYESESTSEETAGCRAAFYLDLSTFSGEIPIEIAEQIGYNGSSLNFSCNIHNERAPKEQLELF